MATIPQGREMSVHATREAKDQILQIAMIWRSNQQMTFWFEQLVCRFQKIRGSIKMLNYIA
jgi:hypothetical protein